MALGLAAAAQAQQATPLAKQVPPGQTASPMGRPYKPAAERAKVQAERLTEKLQLSGAAHAKVEQILRTRMEKVEALKSQQAGGIKPQVQAIREESEAAMKAALTPEQYTQYTALKTEHKGKHKGMHKQHGTMDLPTE